MKCPNRNCIDGDVPETTSATEHLPLICPACQKRFCPSSLCGHRELNEDYHCRECGNHFPERHEEQYEDSSGTDPSTAASGADDFENFKKAVLRRR